MRDERCPGLKVAALAIIYFGAGVAVAVALPVALAMTGSLGG